MKMMTFYLQTKCFRRAEVYFLIFKMPGPELQGKLKEIIEYLNLINFPSLLK